MSTIRLGSGLLAAAIMVLGTACGVQSVTGTPQAAAPVATSTSGLPPLSTPAPGEPAAEVLPWTRVTDPQTGTSAELPGPPTVTETTIPNPRAGADATAPIRVHQAQTAMSGTVQLAVLPRLPGGNFDFEQDVELNRANVSGTVESKRPVTVDGHRGLDYVISYRSTEGKPSIVHGRVVETQGFAARITTRGVNKDLASVAAVHARASSSLRVPAA